MKTPNQLRTLVEMQGYLSLCDAEIRGLAPWLKVAPAVCATVALAGTVMASPAVLWWLAAVAFLGAALPVHPFDLPYHLFLSGRKGRPKLPASALPRRFACTMATVWLAVTGAAFAGGFATLGYALGGSFFVTAMVPATTDLCIPSFIWTCVLGLPSRLGSGAGRGASARAGST